jgi:hypothetical protein
LIDRGEPDEVLPAHQWRFVGLVDRATQLIEHHQERLAEVLHILQAARTATLWEIAAQLHWYTPWAEFNSFLRRAALSETRAHVVYLERRGDVVGKGQRPRLYAIGRQPEGT